MKIVRCGKIWIPPIQLAVHEFYVSCREFSDIGYSNREIFERLNEHRRVSVRSSSILFSIMGVIFLASHRGSGGAGYLKVDLPYLPIYIDNSLVTLLISLLWFFGLLSVASCEMAILYSMAWKRYWLRQISPLADRLLECDGAFIDPFTPKFRFFRSGITLKIFAISTILFMMTPFIILSSYMIVSITASSLYGITHTDSTLSLISYLSCVFLLYFPFILFAFMHIPLPYRRNVSYIRWSFLSKLDRNRGDLHPMAIKWANEEKSL